MEYTIDIMSEQDWEEVRSIYLEGIATGNATFETTVPTWEIWISTHLAEASIVLRSHGEILGWAALSPVSSRCVYAGVAEVSLYIKESSRGKGVGRILLEKLIQMSEEQGIWTLQSGIFSENKPSIELHKKYGFREVGKREKIGKLHGVWRDIVLLERRSRVVGVE